MTIVFGSDHAGFGLRQVLADQARTLGLVVSEVGASSPEPYDYPDSSDLVAKAILEGQAQMGVLVCGTGIGVSIRANRYHGIRAAVCCSVETAELARQHNHANVLCVGARTTSNEVAAQILNAFLETPENQEERHVRRVEKLDAVESAI